MTAREAERLTRVEEKLDITSENNNARFDGLDRKLDKIVDRLDRLPDNFVTRREVAVLKSITALLIAAVTAIATVLLVGRK